MRNFDVVTIIGPSCSGKSLLERTLEKSSHFYRTISVTTRPPRPGEVHGEHYYFVTHEQMTELARTGSLFEHVEFAGNRYGGFVSEFDTAWHENKIPIVVCEPVGMKQITHWCTASNRKQLIVHFSPQPYVVTRFVRERINHKDAPESLLARMRSFINEYERWCDIITEHCVRASQKGHDSIQIDQFETASDLLFASDRIHGKVFSPL